MAGHAAIGVDDDLAAGETGVTHRATDLEAAGGVDERAVGGGVEVGALIGELRQHGRDDVLLDVGRQQVVEGDVGGVLGGQHDGVEPDGLVAVVGDGDLGLAVGAQVGDLAGLADRGELLGEAVREEDRQRHQLGGVVARVAEHQALVAGTLLVERVDATGAVLVGRVDALGDVGALLADRHLDAAGGAVEALGGGVVADAEHGVAHDLGDLDVGLGRDLTGDVHESGGHHRLDGDAAAGVLVEHGVEDRVGDLVTDLVRVSLGDGLGGEQACGHANLLRAATADGAGAGELRTTRECN